MNTVRLNKLLATRGIGARRKCDTLIESGAVSVNGKVVTAPGTRVVPGRDRITVSGRPLPDSIRHRYFMLHKPVGVISTLSDPEGRASIRELLPGDVRLYPVGRLDADTSGLLIITNDGELAHHLMHPRYGLTKFYRVLVESEPDDVQLRRLAEGVVFEPGLRSAPARVRRRDPVARGAVFEIAIHEGRHRQVRLMCEAVGLRVIGLHRWAYGPLKLGELARGVLRELSEAEVAQLRGASARPAARRFGAGRPASKRPFETRVEPDRSARSLDDTPRRESRRPVPPRAGRPSSHVRSRPERFVPGAGTPGRDRIARGGGRERSPRTSIGRSARPMDRARGPRGRSARPMDRARGPVGRAAGSGNRSRSPGFRFGQPSFGPRDRVGKPAQRAQRDRPERRPNQARGRSGAPTRGAQRARDSRRANPRTR